MNPIIEATRPLYPLKIWEDLSPQFLATFWALTMYDLATPEAIYAKELAKLKVLKWPSAHKIKAVKFLDPEKAALLS